MKRVYEITPDPSAPRLSLVTAVSEGQKLLVFDGQSRSEVWPLDAPEVRCDTSDFYFTVGANRLGLEPGKGVARPICRRSHDRITALLSEP